MSMRLLMMGTGSFALPTFRSLCDSSHRVVGLVTQPDRTGRGHHHHVNDMKRLAEERQIPVFQPKSANHADSLARLREFEADLFVVAAYGQILSAELLSIPPIGAINVHASLLPRYRGAAPIVYAILHGDKLTGVSIFRIRPKLDAGPVLGTVSTPIRPKETAGELESRLAELAPQLTLEVIGRLERGNATELPQDASRVTTAPRLKKEQGAICWSQPSEVIECHVRAMQPWPKPYTFLHLAGQAPQRLLVLDVDPIDIESGRREPGGVLPAEHLDELIVATGNGAVRINRLQPAGKRPMSARDFLLGHRLTGDEWFGDEEIRHAPE